MRFFWNIYKKSNTKQVVMAYKNTKTGKIEEVLYDCTPLYELLEDSSNGLKLCRFMEKLLNEQEIVSNRYTFRY